MKFKHITREHPIREGSDTMSKSRARLSCIIDKCWPCTRHDGINCLGWEDPAYMWRDGFCEHYSNDPLLQDEINSAIDEYSCKR